MRDGVRLSTDLYFPEGIDGRLPVVLIRTPYNKLGYRRAQSAAPRQFAGQGYVVAVQDTRGRFASEGEYVVQGNDVNDGYDTVDWLARQAWSNGNIGTIGCSYEGDVQILQSQARHPNLKAMIPQAAGSSIGAAGNRYYYFGARKGGNVELAGGLGWFANNGNKVRSAPRAPLRASTFRKFWDTLPLLGMVERAGGPPSDWNEIVSRELDDPWWDQFGYLKGNEKFDAPASNCRSETATSRTIVGDRELGDAQFDYFNLQSEVEARQDVLVYTTAPLKEGVEVTGPISATLYVSSSARDTDFTVKLVDVYPNGVAYNVQEGVLRARHREGFTRKVWMKPNEVYEVTVDLEVTSNYFAPGHCIRVEVSSSNFPRFDRNLNTGGANYDETKWVRAENLIHHSAKYPSHILLPVIP
jgi:predicted acyl esterase